MTDLPQRPDVSLRQAALVSATSLLVSAVLAPIAYLGIVPKLVVHGDAAATIANVAGNQGLFLAGILCFLVTFVADVVLAWSLYVLFAPAGRALSLLGGWFRLVYTVLAVVALLHLVDLLRVARNADYREAFGPQLLQAQVQLMASSFRWEWGVSFVFFSVHLVLLGVLAWRSGYVPKVLGALLVVNGLAYLVDNAKPYLFPTVPLPFLPALFFGELFFMVWLFARGRRLPSS